MELALQVIGMRLTGRVNDAKSVAMNIISQNNHGLDASLNHTGDASSSGSPLETLQNDRREEFLLDGVKYCVLVDSPHPINFSIQNARGQTLMNYAILKGYKRMAAFLLRQPSVLVNLIDKNGWTCLHWACFLAHDDVEMVKMLLERGASPLLPNKQGKLPRDLTQNEKVLELLREYEDRNTLERENEIRKELALGKKKKTEKQKEKKKKEKKDDAEKKKQLRQETTEKGKAEMGTDKEDGEKQEGKKSVVKEESKKEPVVVLRDDDQVEISVPGISIKPPEELKNASTPAYFTSLFLSKATNFIARHKL